MQVTTPSTSIGDLVAIAVGGALGTLLRASAGTIVDVPAGDWPWPTLAVNLIGSAALGWFVGRVGADPRLGRARPFVAVGLLGSLTTFSSFAVEALDLLREAGAADAVLYAGVSMIGGVALARRCLRAGSR